MYLEAFIEFLRANVEPIRSEHFGTAVYRAAARFRDGSLYPCVRFQSATSLVPDWPESDRYPSQEAIQSAKSTMFFQLIGRNTIAANYIDAIERSPYALPKPHLETLLAAAVHKRADLIGGCLGFSMEMDDGVRFGGRLTEGTEFVALPDGYTVDRIVSIGPSTRTDLRVVGNHSAFDCFIQGL